MRRGRTFRSGKTRPADGQSNNSETLSRIQSLADYTIDTLESSFRKRQAAKRRRLRRPTPSCHRPWAGPVVAAGLPADLAQLGRTVVLPPLALPLSAARPAPSVPRQLAPLDC